MLLSERIESRINEIVSKQLGISKDIIDAINTFQWKITLEATRKFSNIEITNLGRLKVKQKLVDSNLFKLNSIKNAYEKQLKNLTDEKEIARLNIRIEGLIEDINFLESKKR